MPGGTLDQLERSLDARWSRPHGLPYPLLRSIKVGGTAGLRGLNDVELRLDYPLTAIVGRNATGKSTWLALAALAFHSPPDHIPRDALRKPGRGESGTYYTFQDFFFRGPGDLDNVGVEITWDYGGQRQPLVVRRKSDRKWMEYERRPRRPVHFVGIARTVPAIERRVLRAHFPPTPRSVRSHPLEPEYLGYLKRITGLPYQGAEVLETQRHELRSARTEHTYSSFNMGAGEDLLIEILYLLQTTPPGSLVVVEEVELGLHPRAVRELARVLLEITHRKGLQLIVSSHSPDFIDALPRKARVLVERPAGVCRITHGPTTRLAMGELGGEQLHETTVYCEDEFARQLLHMLLPAKTSQRIRVQAVGADSELVRYAGYHARAEMPGRALVVWDGDVTQTNIEEWLRRQGVGVDVSWVRLPGDDCPERWVASHLASERGIAALERLFNADRQRVEELVARLQRLDDPHYLAAAVAHDMCMDIGPARTLLLAALREVPEADISPVTQAIEAVLVGKVVEDGVERPS